MSAARHGAIVCEGYQDRHFWDGWLRHLGWAEDRSVVSGRRQGEPGGQYGYRHGTHTTRVVPAGSKAEILPAALDFLREPWTLTHLVLNEDPDLTPRADATQLPLPRNSVQAHVEALGWVCETAPGFPILATRPDRVAVTIHRLLWTCPDPPAPGLPAVDTLERLVCAALLAAYPDRGPAVQHFLNHRPEAPADHPHKAIAMTHMAGWYAPHGSFDFYRTLWDDPAIAVQLESRLRASGAWAIAEALAGP